MFENFSTTKQERSAEEELHADFEVKEKATVDEGTNFLENLEPEKYKKKAANLLLAFSLFVGASSAFAGEQEISKDNLPEMGQEQIAQVAEKREAKNQTAGFDWKKIVGKIEISAGAKKEDIKEFNAESIDFRGYKTSKFYEGITSNDVEQVFSSNYSSIYGSQNSSEFFKNIALSQQGFSDKQKAMTLQHLGAILSGTYNYDMLNAGDYVAVSSDKMFQALKDKYLYGNATKSGICGNIHTFLTKTAESLGIEAFLQNGLKENGLHIWSGLVLGSGAERQIVFLDYGTLVPTGTLNYQDALGIAEKYHKSVAVFTSFAGSGDEILFPVKSRAQEVVGRAMGEEEIAGKLGHNLENGELKKEGSGLGVNISPETKEIKLTSDSFGLAFFDFKNSSNNPYQSLEGLSAVRGSASFGGEKAGIETGITVLNMSVKDLYRGTVSTDEIVGKLAANYVEKKQLTKNEYGQFLVSFGATLEGALKMPLGNRVGNKDNYNEGKVEGAIGGRLIYVDPSNVGKVYLGASEVFRGQGNDFQNQDFVIKEASKNFVVGGEVKVFEGDVVKMEVGKSDLDWGKSFNIKSGLESGKFKGTVGYEKKTSDYERFIPSSEKFEVGVGYKGGPSWEVNVIGAKTTEKYKDADSKDAYNAEVKLKIFLW